MHIRNSPEYIPFMEALITLVDLFPTDLVLYGIMMAALWDILDPPLIFLIFAKI